MTVTIFCVGGAGSEIGKKLWKDLPQNVKNKINQLVFVDSDKDQVGSLDAQSEGKLFKWRRLFPEEDKAKIKIFNIGIRHSRQDLTGVFKNFINNPKGIERINPDLQKVRASMGWNKWIDDEYIDLFKNGDGGVGRRRSASFALFTFAFFHDKQNYDKLRNILATNPDKIIIITSFGGGTGSGSHLQLARLIKFITRSDIYLVGILPHSRERDTEQANALHALAEHIYLGKKEQYLFSIDRGVESDLNKGVISERLANMFKNQNIPYSEKFICTKESDDKWAITDEETGNSYAVGKGEEKLNVYKKPKGWYDANPFNFVFLFDAQTFRDKYPGDWESYMDLGVFNFIHNFLLSSARFIDLSNFNI